MKQLLIIALLLISSHASAFSIQWIPLGATNAEGNPSTIGGNPIIEYKNAGKDGIDWTATGDGKRGGMGVRELWLFDDSASGRLGTSAAKTSFSVASNSISFIMNGDHNDGWARFFVDDVDVGAFDLYETGLQNLVVTGLDFTAHSLEIVQLGRHNPNATKGDVAIIGGAAFNIISEPTTLALFLIASLYFIGGFNNKNRPNKHQPIPLMLFNTRSA